MHESRTNVTPRACCALPCPDNRSRYGLEREDSRVVGCHLPLGAHIGFVHTYVEKVRSKGHEYLRVRIDMEQRVRRGRDIAVTRLTYGTIEALDGQVLRLDTYTQLGQQRIRTYGDVKNGQMNLITEGAGQRQEQLVAWGPEVRGPYAAEQSMVRNPMKPHEKRRLKMFMPSVNKVCDVELEALEVEPTIMGDGTERKLLHVEQKTIIDGVAKPEFDVRLWVDDQGQALKQETDILGGYVQYRTSERAAKNTGGRVQLDLISASFIKVSRPIPNADKARMVRYNVMVKGTEPAKIIPTDSRQSLQAGPIRTRLS